MKDVTDLYRSYGDDRLPPGQRRTEEFPVLQKGTVPKWTPDEWRFEVWGAVSEPLQLTFQQFRDLPSETQKQDFHCVTGWSKFDCVFTGVPFREIADRAGVTDEAEHVMFHALDGYTTNLPLETCLREEVMFVYGFDGSDLQTAHGGPLRVVTPHKYAYKGAKWVTGVEFLTEPERGYWELRGYSNTANPWEESR
ncbi:MAG: sulfite oxidase-like oxidoreductase, partial [Halobacteriota archaeon]